MVNLVKAIMSTEKSDIKQMKWLKKQLRNNECDINKQRANMAPIHAAVITDNTEIVKLIVKTKGVDVDAACKKEVDGEMHTHGVLDVALKQLHPSIEIIKILLEVVRNPVSCDGCGVPACIVEALDCEYFDILELFRGKDCLLGAMNGSKFFKLASVIIRMDKPPLLRWLLQLPEVISFMDEGDDVKREIRKRFFTLGLFEYARERDGLDKLNKMCELLTEFIGESRSGDDDGMSFKDSITEVKEESQGGLEDEDGMSLKDCITVVKGESQDGLDVDEEGMSLKDSITEVKGESQGGFDGDEEGMSLKDCITEAKGESQGGLDGDEEAMSSKDCITEVKGESQGGLDGDEEGMSLRDCITEVKGESQGGLDGDEEEMSLKDCITEVKGKNQVGLGGDEEGMSLKDCSTEVKGESQGGFDGDEEGMSLKDCVPASANPPEDNSKGIKNTDDVAVKIKYCWNCENPSKYMCVGCRKARYCESSCQWEDWASHKEYCLVQMNKFAFKEFKSISPSIFQ